MFPLYVFFGFLLGAVVGSFLNVVILRMGSGRSLGGRSFCFTCARQLHWYELVPICSYFALRGKCRSCGSSISVQYVLIELLTAAIFALLFWKFAPLSYLEAWWLLYYLLVFSILIVIVGYDWRHKVIPDGLSFLFSALSLGAISVEAYLYGFSWGPFLAGPLLSLPFVLLWVFSRGRLMGLGDGKLVLGIGWFLGFLKGFTAILFAFWIGAVVMLSLILIQRLFVRTNSLTMKSEIPFGPFLILGLALVFFTEVTILTLLIL